MRSEERDELLSRLVKILSDFHSSLARQLSNPDNKATFQAELYENIDPETAKAIIAANYHPNCDIHEISTSVNCLTIFFFEKECVLVSYHLSFLVNIEHLIYAWFYKLTL